MKEDHKAAYIDTLDIKKDFSQILYNQNQTIFELTNEINKKDLIIKQLSNNKASLSEATQAQLQTYKKEVKLLQTKLSMSSSEYGDQLATQEETIKSFQSQIKQLNDTLAIKDRKLNELLSIVEEYDNQSTSQIKQISHLEKTNKELRSVINDMSTNYQKVSVKLSNKKEEAKSTFDSVYNIQLEKEALEEKAKELVEIIKEYSIELSKLKKTNTLLIEQNDNVKRDNEEMVQLNYDLDQRLTNVNEEYSLIKNENSSLMNKIIQYEKMMNTISQNNKKLQINNEQINGLIKKKETEIYQTENLNQDFSLKINNDLLSIANWINGYLLLPVNNDKEDETKQKLTFESNQSSFDLLIKALENVREKNNEESNSLSNKIVNLTQKLENKNKEYNGLETELKENKDHLRFLKEENDKLKDENVTHEHNNKRYQAIINELNNKIVDHNFAVNKELPGLISQMIKEVNETNILGERKSFASIFFNDKSDINELIIKLIEQYKEVLSLNNKNCNTCLQLKNEYKAIEKKYNALLTDIELKQIQIQKQEEMINRRQINISNDKEIIKKLQIEKEQLLQDNVTLIQQNTKLKAQIQ